MPFTISQPDCWYVGVDLHKDTFTAALFHPASGECRFERIACKCRDKILEFFTTLPQPHAVAIEAVGFYRWLWEMLEPKVQTLHLADATQCRALAGRRIKTDRQDAMNVAELLAAGRLPQAWAPPTHVAQLRDRTRHRHYLSRQHARTLHRVKSIMNLLNRPGPARMKAPALIRYLKAQRGKIPDHLVSQLEMAADELILLERQLDRIDQELAKLLEGDKFADAAKRLMSVPGVKVVLTATILAEVGDFSRFDHRDGLTRYAGLDPRLFASGDTRRTGAIAKCGSRELRYALVQGAWTAVRVDPELRCYWLGLKKRMDGRKAIIPVARKLLLRMRAAVRDGQDYRPGH